MLAVVLCGCAVKNPPQTVGSVDLSRYMGVWYEISSFPSVFQKGCSCTKTQYQLDGKKVRVLNSCIRGKPPKLSRIEGKAWPVIDGQNAKLAIQFFWPFYGNYWILDVSPGYQYALVGTPNRKFLWVLSRKPTMGSKAYKKMVAIAHKKGFDVSKLVKTQQDCRDI